MAWWLLLLLLRVLTPEAALLRLHPHEHTETEEHATSGRQEIRQAVLTPQHLHCHMEQVYDVPFLLTDPLQLPTLVAPLSYARYYPQGPLARASHLLDGASLRGPPARS
ncbi:hypothetical protein [Hymenobacter arizonensis]|uniref:Uncharacterized protein n=1 Tax=Hymenobacter arizonensis TaxID=1227077 RepID=A0A1I5Z6F2_HYMAR|nr:hypothetical protein [Hymenobacter arizonensis]SFQ51697.1 hypothetical protein SAMN04515668_2732 [Hymenobacter arizonensis]